MVMVEINYPKKFSKQLKVPDFKIEERLFNRGYSFIAGVDEVGRGAWAGPLYAATVILPNKRIYKVRDSKLLSADQRQKLAPKIKAKAVDFSYGRVEVEELSRMGMTKATRLAFKRALAGLKNLDYILTDYFKLKFRNLPSQNIVRGDQGCLSIAVASIIAKVERDRVMTELAKKFPQYDFINNKGYSSPNHQQALKNFGPCLIHRPNFAPIKEALRACQAV
jgi:ribonuclease HII